MHRGWRRGTVVGVLLVALPRRFRGRFLTIKRRFVDTVVALSWHGSVVDASWMASWHRRGRPAGRLATTVSWTIFDNKTTVRGNRRDAIGVWKCRGCIVDGVVALLWACCWSPCHDGFMETVVAMSWRGSVVDALWMMLWHRPGRVAGCPATTVLWKPSWHPNVHNRGHCRWTVVGGHAIYPNPRGQQAHSCRRPCSFVSPRPNTTSFPAKQIKKISYKKTRQCIANKAHSTGSGLSHLTIDIHPSQLNLTIEASEALATWSCKQRTQRVDFLQHTEQYLETLHIQTNRQKLESGTFHGVASHSLQNA